MATEPPKRRSPESTIVPPVYVFVPERFTPAEPVSTVRDDEPEILLPTCINAVDRESSTDVVASKLAILIGTLSVTGAEIVRMGSSVLKGSSFAGGNVMSADPAA
jgi:hypothetical protein